MGVGTLRFYEPPGGGCSSPHPRLYQFAQIPLLDQVTELARAAMQGRATQVVAGQQKEEDEQLAESTV